MEAEHLSDDCRQWPSDPYAVLGVARGADLRTIRLAYSSLIKRFKPEHHPVEFEKIRLAYEDVQRIVQMFGESEIVESSGTSDADFDPQSPDSTTVASPSETVDEIEAVWKGALEGDRLTAWRRLSELAQQRPRDAVVVERMFWLLKVDPEMSVEQTPASLLIDFLERQRLFCSIDSLLQEELRFVPEVTLTEQFTDFIRSHRDAFRVETLLDVRWRHAVDESMWNVVLEDLIHLERQWQIDDRPLLLRLLRRGVEVSIWDSISTAEAVIKHCRERLQACDDLQLAHDTEFERVEMLETCVEQLGAFNRETPGFEQVIAPVRDVLRLHLIYGSARSKPALISLVSRNTTAEEIVFDEETVELFNMNAGVAMQLLLEVTLDVGTHDMMYSPLPYAEIDQIIRLHPMFEQQMESFVTLINSGQEPFFITASQLHVMVLAICISERLPFHAVVQGLSRVAEAIGPEVQEALDRIRHYDFGAHAYINAKHIFWQSVKDSVAED
ncbi:MAG: J domain-containing protein [Planctomycetaceae bacterium]